MPAAVRRCRCRPEPPKERLTPSQVEEFLATWDRYAWDIAYRWHGRNPGIDVGELYAEVRAGFVQAAAKFDPSLGTKFSTYATWWGNNFARQYVRREAARGMHVPADRIVQLYHLDLDAPPAPGGDKPSGNL